MNKSKTCGVYVIKNNINGKLYIGSSISVYYRWSKQHKPALVKNKHYNRHLQSTWNKYGEQSFQFQVIEECTESMLVEREGYWIEYYQSWDRKHGYNLARVVNGRHVVSEETRRIMSKISRDVWREKQETYWTTGRNKEILDMFKNGISKNKIAKMLNINRNVVYDCLEYNGLHINNGKGKVVKLTSAIKQLIFSLRNEGMSWEDILEQTGVSKTQVYRTNIAGDGKYGTTKVKRQTYRTVTPEVVEKVTELREQGIKWEEIEKEVGVSRFALHQNGITQQLKKSRKGETKRRLTSEDREKILQLLKDGKSIIEISNITGIAKSTIRLQRNKHVN